MARIYSPVYNTFQDRDDYIKIPLKPISQKVKFRKGQEDKIRAFWNT